MRACPSGSSAALAHEHADPPHPLGLLRARRERPRRRRAAEQRMNSRRLTRSPRSARARSIGYLARRNTTTVWPPAVRPGLSSLSSSPVSVATRFASIPVT